MSERNVELARQGYEAVLRGDLDVIADLLAEDVRWHGGDPNAVGSCRNRNEALEVMRQASGRIGELVDVVGAGDKVVVIMRPVGAGSEPIANLTTFRDGKVVEMVHYPDPAAALSDAGG